MMDLQVGSTIGDYEIVGILGAGGMGKVYKVRNLISDRVEAMKVLLPDLANAPEQADRFLREIKVQASLEHPNIASLHTAVRQDNQLLMLMEFVDGVTLEQRLKQGPLPVEEAVNYICQVLSALEYAHSRGVIHRDIKPANMMLTPAGVVKLMDFGIAKASTDHKLTMTGTTMGSLYYMSPEQIQGAAGLDARADLYSVGVSMYELVTGKRPFDGDSQFAIMSAHLEKTPIPPIQLDPRLPQALNDAIVMSVAKAPDARFQTAKAFRNALSNSSAPATLAAPAPVAAAVPPATESRSKRGLWMALGSVAAVAALVAVIELAPSKGTKAAVHPAPQTTAAPVQPATAEPAATTQAPPPSVSQSPTEPSVEKPAEKPVDPIAAASKPRPVQSGAQAAPQVRPQATDPLPTQVSQPPQSPPQTVVPAAPPSFGQSGTQPRGSAEGSRSRRPARKSRRDGALQHAKPATLASRPGLQHWRSV